MNCFYDILIKSKGLSFAADCWFDAGSANQIIPVQCTNPSCIAEAFGPQDGYISAIIYIITQRQCISDHRIDVDNRAFHRKSDQMILVYVKSDYFLQVHMWRSSLSTITVCRFWQKQYGKTIHHCSFFTLEARQSEWGRLKIYSRQKNLWDSPESWLRLYASGCGESVNAKLEPYTFKQHQGNTASHGPFNALRVRSMTFTKQQPAWMIEMEIFTLAGWCMPTATLFVQKKGQERYFHVKCTFMSIIVI